MSKSNRSNRSRDSHKEPAKRELEFNAYDITAATAETAILLLESHESEILCRTLRAITKFTEHDVQNRQALYNMKVLTYLLPHVDHAELNVRRFALKALAQMCQLPQSPYQVLINPSNLAKIANMIVQDEDLFVLEFASLVLAELTREPLGCDQLIAANILDSIFYRMRTCTDPDVQHNCIQILSNLISDPGTAAGVTSSQNFVWPPLLALLKSKYIQIQKLALTTVDQLICRYKDQIVQETFRTSTGIYDLCDLFEAYEFRDVHIDVLQVLKNYAETEENAAHMYQSGCLQRLLKYLDESLPSTKPHCLAVLTRMSYTGKGRDALHETGTDVIFCEQLLSDDVELLADAAMGVAKMSQLLPAANTMMDTNVIETLFAIIYDESVEWFDGRLNSLLAVSKLCRVLPAAALCVVEPTLFTILRNINRHYEYNPLEAQRLAVQCYIHLQDYECGLHAMITADFIKELLGILRRIDIILKMKTCSVLVGVMRDDIAKNLFTDCHGEKVVSDNLRIEHLGLRSVLCTLICAGATYRGADVYLGLGTIQYMFENKKARYALTVWESALEVMFSHHPSAKFAFTKKLDINDYTRDYFYVQKRSMKSLPTLSTLTSSASRTYPVFVVVFGDQQTQPQDVPPPGSGEPTTPYGLPCDENLFNYIARVRIMFSMYRDPNTRERGKYQSMCQIVSSSLLMRARVLGVFVAIQMCGVTQEMDCSMPSVSLHLADLMMALNSCLIGIGFVKSGGALERAVLYKVLADRIALPCALHRGTRVRAWCEVAVPDEEPKDSMRDNLYPGHRLRANYVVDLMDDPGSLHSPYSAEAQRIRGY